MPVKFYQDRLEMLQVRSLILYFFLLVLEISLNFCLDIGHKRDKFSKILLEKDLKFILNKGDGTVMFNLSLVLLLVEVDFILAKQGCIRHAFVVCHIGHIKIILALSTEVITFYI